MGNQKTIIRPILRPLLCWIVLLACGCTSTAVLAPQGQPLQPNSPADEIAEEAVVRPSTQKKVAQNKPRQSTSEIKTEEEQKSSGLLNCDDNCRANCSAKMQSSPKWCVLYEK